MPEITLVQAVNLALARAMADDPSVLVIGEDVGAEGGVFRATEGLLDRFGPIACSTRRSPKGVIAGMSVGPRRAGFPPGVGDPIHRLHLSDDRPAGEPRLAAAHPHARPAQLPDGRALALWRRDPRRRAPFREPGGDVCPHSGSAGGDPVLAGARLWPAAGGDPRPRPGRLSRTDPALPRGARGGRGQRRGIAARPLLCACARAPTSP